jgi:dihydroorotase
LKANEDKVTLIKEKWHVPGLIPVSDGSSIIPFKAGETLDWKMKT